MFHFRIYDAPISEENRKEAERIITLVYEKFGVFTPNFRTRIDAYISFDKYSTPARISIDFIGTVNEFNRLCATWGREEQ